MLLVEQLTVQEQNQICKELSAKPVKMHKHLAKPQKENKVLATVIQNSPAKTPKPLEH